jgi:hypothetical protein
MKPPSKSARLKLQKFRAVTDKKVAPPERKQYTQDEVKKLFKNWR